MVVMLVHWLIKKGREAEFEQRWRRMMVAPDAGLYREILTKIEDTVENPKFHTFSVGNPHYTTYINVGVWESVDQFDAAIGKYIPEAIEREKEDGRKTYTVELEAFEFKLRERVVLKVVADRGGQLPNAEIEQ